MKTLKSMATTEAANVAGADTGGEVCPKCGSARRNYRRKIDYGFREYYECGSTCPVRIDGVHSMRHFDQSTKCQKIIFDIQLATITRERDVLANKPECDHFDGEHCCIANHNGRVSGIIHSLEDRVKKIERERDVLARALEIDLGEHLYEANALEDGSYYVYRSDNQVSDWLKRGNEENAMRYAIAEAEWEEAHK